jgi:putative flavoprotein involved in K+ transport
MAEQVETLVIGGGQAGLAMSAHLGRRGLSHLVLERHRIAERWRTERWDSLVANGPAWHDRFPVATFDDIPPDAFATKDRIAAYFEEFAQTIGAPIRCGEAVTALRREGAGFRAVTAGGEIVARQVVVATGPFQKPVFPAMIPESAGVMQIHSNGYRNPGQLPAGAVLVIGAGSSGAQIADELLRSGREAFLSVGPHDRPPRAYRGRDFVWWLGALGKWDARAQTPGTEHVTIAVSGALGGHTVDFRNLGNRGMKLVGRTDRCEGVVLHFSADLAENIARGDANYLSVLDEADAHAAREGLDLPEEPGARMFEPVPDCVTNPILSLDLKAAGVSAVIWATGYVLDFSWIEMDIFDDKGRPRHDKGVSEVPGLYFLGLPWLSRRASPFIWGVWHDADHLAGVIAGEGA